MTEQKEEQQKVLGFVARQDVNPEITFQEFFQLMLKIEDINKLFLKIKQTNFNNDNMRYYFESDLEDMKDEQGNVIMTKNQQGQDIPQKTLKSTFWESETQEKEENHTN